MTSQQLSKLIINPGLVNGYSLDLLEDFVTRYPYCQSGQLLLACNLYVEENPRYPNQLKKAAAFAGDRRILRGLIGRAKATSSIPVPASPITASPAVMPHPQPSFRTSENASHTYERMTQAELLAIVKKRLAEIESEKKRGQEFSTDQIFQIPKSEIRTGAKRSSAEPNPNSEITSTKASLIEKFIQDEPRISKPKTTFFNPTDSAIRSNFDDEEIVSETLAQLYAQQGNIPKAIHIFEKLSLINQEKSRYFAAQIEKLNS